MQSNHLFSRWAGIVSLQGMGVVLLGLVLLALVHGCGGNSGAPPAPVITLFEASPSVITVGDASRLKVGFANGSGVVDQGVGPVVEGTEVEVHPLQDVTYTLTVTNASQMTTKATFTVRVLAAPIQPLISAPSFVATGISGYLAEVPDQPGCTFAWAIDGGTIEQGQYSRTVQFTAGTPGILALQCTATNLAGKTAKAAATVSVLPAPLQPLISAPSFVVAGTSGNLADVPDQSGCTFAWAMNGATIEQGQYSRSVQFTAGTPGILELQCTATNLAGYAVTGTIRLRCQSGTTPPTATGEMTTPRAYHTATLLVDGTILLAGGQASAFTLKLASAEVFDPTSNTFHLVGSMQDPRAGHTSTRLLNGKVLIAGGWNNTEFLDRAELYDPASGTFTPTTGKMTHKRADHTATLLGDGRVLIFGGWQASNDWVAESETYDPGTGTFSVVGPPHLGRVWHTATRLNGGHVLLAGGWGASGPTTASAELFNPTTNAFTVVGDLVAARELHVAVKLSDGRVMICGGANDQGASPAFAEFFDPATLTFQAGPVHTSLRFASRATLMGVSRVVLAGGARPLNPGYETLQTVETWDPGATQFSPADPMLSRRQQFTATLLLDGTLLIAGGETADGATTLGKAEIYH